MKSILIVTHCYAKELPHFASFLRYQLQSILDHYQDAVVAVCYTDSDRLTVEVLDSFRDRMKIRGYCMSPGELWRRCIGRNYAAKQCEEDLVWFTDVDHVFGENCLKVLCRTPWDPKNTMIYPRLLRISKDHATGDGYADTEKEIDPRDFVEKRYGRAIGGVQIVLGKLARKIGYLDGSERWQVPAEVPFPDFRDDVEFRVTARKHGEIGRIELPNLYRLRHSRTTYQEDVK